VFRRLAERPPGAEGTVGTEDGTDTGGAGDGGDTAGGWAIVKVPINNPVPAANAQGQRTMLCPPLIIKWFTGRRCIARLALGVTSTWMRRILYCGFDCFCAGSWVG
jgi:hypothetical protein